MSIVYKINKKKQKAQGQGWNALHIRGDDAAYVKFKTF